MTIDQLKKEALETAEKALTPTEEKEKWAL